MEKESVVRNDEDTKDFLARGTKMALAMFLPGIKVLVFFSALSVYGPEVPASRGSTLSLLLVVLSLGTAHQILVVARLHKETLLHEAEKPAAPASVVLAGSVCPAAAARSSPRFDHRIRKAGARPGDPTPTEPGRQPPVSPIRQGDQVAAVVPIGQIPEASLHLPPVGAGHTGSAKSIHDSGRTPNLSRAGRTSLGQRSANTAWKLPSGRPQPLTSTRATGNATRTHSTPSFVLPCDAAGIGHHTFAPGPAPRHPRGRTQQGSPRARYHPRLTPSRLR